jgi:hypothetical protein
VQVIESPEPQAGSWTGTSVIIDEEPYVPDAEFEAASTPGEHPDHSRLATLHLLKHYKEGPGIW